MTENDKALVERLREDDTDPVMLNRTADRIEALAAENERLREAALGMMEALEQARAVLDEHFGALPTEYPMPEIKAALAAARAYQGEGHD